MTDISLNSIHHIHCIGAGGIGVSALARYFAAEGKQLSGSDQSDARKEPGLLPEGMTFFAGHQSGHITDTVDLVIRSSAVPDTNPEIIEARRRNIPVLLYAEALGLIGKSLRTIGVSGTHGKSTTTALLGKFLEAGGKDPSVIIGARVPGWNYNLRLGQSDLLVVEACEYERHMLLIHPQVILLTNIEADHLDYYSGIEDILDAFRTYIADLPDNGLLVFNQDDPHARTIAATAEVPKVSYSIGSNADLVARTIRSEHGGQSFELVWHGDSYGRFHTTLPGTYNISNILGAAAVALIHGAGPDAIREALESFDGIGRRFERLGHLGDTAIISDYAHHPTALKGAAEAVLAEDPEALVVFQPHQKDRTKKLFAEFVKVMRAIPNLVVVEIYEVAGREQNEDVSSEQLTSLLNSEHTRAHPAQYVATLAECEALLREAAKGRRTILLAGAGDIHTLARTLISTS